MISAVVAAMTFSAQDADAQATRRSSTSSENTRTETRSSGHVTATSRSTGSSASSARQNTTARQTSSSTRQSSTSNRQSSTAATKAQQDRRTTGSSSSAVRSSSSSSDRKTTTSASSNRVTGSSRDNSSTRTEQERRGSATVSASSAADRKPATVNRGQSGSSSAALSQTPQSGTPVRATSRAGLTSANEMQERVTSTASRPAGGITASGNKADSNNRPELNYSGRGQGGIRLDERGDIRRIPPRDRDFIRYDRPGSFYGHDPHYFGHKIHTLPPSYKRVRHWGVDYYFYKNVYYRRYGDHYVICRPPFGIYIDYGFRDVPFARVRFAYYHNLYHTYDRIDENYRVIMEQNRVIAQNNARLARQNKQLALNSSRALSSYEIANTLGLVQSYAGIDSDYFYEDGVFYTTDRKGRYEVIVPPAGALVDELPDDYDVIVLNGVEYYKVDDTVYRLTLIGGTPCLEVLGQMYGSMARQYNLYYQ